jgi:glycosyltransferase involved in cell wall biosynthesis
MTLFSSEHRELQADYGLDVVPGRTKRLGLDLGAVVALRKKLRELQPACLVAHGSQPLKYLAFAAPTRVPVVAYRLGIAHQAAHRPSQRLLHTALYRRALRVAGVSNECLEEAHDLFRVARRKLVLIPNGRDPERFFPAPTKGTGEPPRLIFIGHVTASKRPDFYLDVVADLRAQNVAFEAQMVGDGPLLSSLRERAEQLGVEVMGHRADVPELMRAASVLAFTSIPDGEGMPGVYIEAGLSGVPVVSTDVPGARTVLVEGHTGFVVGVDDRRGFVARTAELLQNPARLAEMGKNARARCSEEFSLARSVARWSELIGELLES